MTIKSNFTHNILGPSGVFKAGPDMPPGPIRWHMDCSADPMNIVAPAQMIVAAIKQRMAKLQPGQKLAVLMGEFHTMPAHILLQQMVLQLLHEDKDPIIKNFTMNFERQHNFLSTIAEKYVGLTIPEGLRYSIANYDPEGHTILSADIIFENDMVHAPVSHKNLMAWCHNRGIKTQFNDAALKELQGSFYIDHEDPYVFELLKSLGQETSTQINALHPIGFAVRNRFMAQRELDYANKNQSRLMIQSAGRDHLLGKAGTKYEFGHPYEDSLTFVLKKQNVIVLPIFISIPFFGVGCLPSDAAQELEQNGILIDGLNTGQFMGISWPQNEAKYIDSFNASSGGNIEIIDLNGNNNRCQDESLAHIKSIIELYKAANPEPP